MSERGAKLMTKASRQLDEIAGFLGTLDEADLHKPCPDESGATGGHAGGGSVGATFAHIADGYQHLGRFLQGTGYVAGSPSAGSSHGHEHRHGHGDHHGHTPAPQALPDLRDRLISGKAPIALLADLADDHLDTVTPAVNPFSDGRRTLEQVIEAVIAHQAEHLATVKRALA
jgi:hypothetical protein